MRNVVILGATGSIGRQCLEVIQEQSGFSVIGLAADSSWENLLDAAVRHRPPFIAMADAQASERLSQALSERGFSGIQVFRGQQGVCKLAALEEADIVVHAIPGFEGVRSLLAALEAGKTVAFAGKEALVSAGDLVTRTVKRTGAKIIPVDSEHNAIFQCLAGEDREYVSGIILTASGGPFWELSLEEMARVGPAEALRHPTWRMGPKITVDSATFFNKALEVIEAHYLFGVGYDRISVLVHREAIVHSMVVFKDGSVKALMSHPDMRLPISYALNYPARGQALTSRLDLEGKTLSFKRPDLKRFPCLELGFRAGRTGGTAPCFISAADEEAVALFLSGVIPYGAIYHVLDLALSGYEPVEASSLEVLEKEARRGKLKVREIVQSGASRT